jgi:hypothetical protein
LSHKVHRIGFSDFQLPRTQELAGSREGRHVELVWRRQLLRWQQPSRIERILGYLSAFFSLDIPLRCDHDDNRSAKTEVKLADKSLSGLEKDISRVELSKETV